jgi:signal transduction histidine kinase
VLAVADTGQGISKPLHESFEPYVTTRDVGQGSGLGLASVYGSVRQSGGFIDATANPAVAPRSPSTSRSRVIPLDPSKIGGCSSPQESSCC